MKCWLKFDASKNCTSEDMMPRREVRQIETRMTCQEAPLAHRVSDSERPDDGVIVQSSRSVVVSILVRIYPVHPGVRVVVARVQDDVGYQLHDLLVIYHNCVHNREILIKTQAQDSLSD